MTIKVLHHAPHFLPSLGGTEVNIYSFAKYSKHKHHVLTDLLPGTPFLEEIDGIQVSRVGPPRMRAERRGFDLMLEYLFGTIRELNKAVRLHGIEFDVMHLHGSYGLPILFDAADKILGFTMFKRILAWRTCRKPIILTLHSTPSHDLPLKAPFLSKPFPSPKTRRSWTGLEMLYRAEAKVIICVDRYMANLMKRFPGDAEVVYIPSGIDTKIFRPMRKEKAYGLLPVRIFRKIEGFVKDFLVLYIGRFDFAKGTQFLEAFARKLPPCMKLIVAGHGDLRLLGTSNNMIYVGKIENKDAPALINSCDAIFNPVLFIGTSRVTFEGMACSKPVIMFNNGTDRYPVIHERNGFQVSSVDEALETVVRLQKDSSLYNRISHEAVRTARENSVRALAKQVDALYGALIP